MSDVCDECHGDAPVYDYAAEVFVDCPVCGDAGEGDDAEAVGDE